MKIVRQPSLRMFEWAQIAASRLIPAYHRDHFA